MQDDILKINDEICNWIKDVESGKIEVVILKPKNYKKVEVKNAGNQKTI